jgi:NAD(P)H-quinone oxidoreductase subunit 5
MPDLLSFAAFLGMIVVATPAVLLVVLGLPSVVGQPMSERLAARSCRWAVGIGLAAILCVLVIMLATGERHVVLDLGKWVAFHRNRPGEHAGFHLAVKFEFDRLSVPLAILSFVLCGTVGAFAVRYLHRERGFNRFFVLFALFLVGMVTASLANTIETLFIGWEFVGLSSALLVAFFHERPAPARNGLWVWVIYRVSDAALLLAAVVLHHTAGEGDFDGVLGTAPWPHGQTSLNGTQSLLIGTLLLAAAAGKSALVPFSGWLPRAMEGPTPSSAVFYGALSVHLGAFLLLRMSPLIASSMVLAVAVVLVGLATAAFAYLFGSVQTDIKSALSFASVVQVGLIVAEIGLGHWMLLLWYVALVHLLGHACLRTLQFLRAPTLLQDYRHLENAIGDRLVRPPGPLAFAPRRIRLWFFRFALERGYLDVLLLNLIVRPFVRFFLSFDRWERNWMAWLSGSPSKPVETRSTSPASPAPVEERREVEQYA